MRQEVAIRASGPNVLTVEDLRRSVPAIFAKTAHESRSDRYVYISTEEVVDRLIEEGFHPVEARLKNKRDPDRRNWAKHMIRFRSASMTQKMRSVGDSTFEIVLRNGHDGTSAYDFMAGLFRLVCLNGMTVSDGTVASIHVRHTGDREKILEDVAAGAQAVLDQAPKVIDAVKLWSSINLSRDEQMAMAHIAHGIRFGEDETPITADQLLHARRSTDQGDDLWRVFNRIQENVVRGGLSGTLRNGRHYTTREVRGIDGDLKLNKALWDMGTRVAAHKAK